MRNYPTYSSSTGASPGGDIGGTRRREIPDDNLGTTRFAQACLYRRRSRGQGIPGLNVAQVQLLHAEEAQADPLRRRDRGGPARPPALPGPGLAVRVLRRPGRLPAGLDGPEGMGVGPAGAGTL